MDQRKCLQEFRLESMPKFASIVIVGQTGSGKTTLMQDLMYHAHHVHKFPQCKMFSGTEHLNHNFKNILPAAAIERGMPLPRVTEFVRRAQSSVEKAMKGHEEDVKSGLYDRILISDDAMPGSKHVTHSTIFEEIFFNGRHFRTTAWIASQEAKKIPTFARSNSEYAFIFFHGSPYDQYLLFSHFSTHIPSFTMFRELMETYCHNYTCLVFHHRTKSHKLEDAVFFYKATPPPADFKFGDPRWWKAAETMTPRIEVSELQPQMQQRTCTDKESKISTVNARHNHTTTYAAKTYTLPNISHQHRKDKLHIQKKEREDQEEQEFVRLALEGLSGMGLSANDPESESTTDITKIEELDAEFM